MQTAHYNCATDASGLAMDLHGNLYMAGAFSAASSDHDGIYIHKYSPAGILLWADTTSETHGTTSGGVVTDSFGNAYTCFEIVSGYPGCSIRIGSNYFPCGYMYIVKYNPNGQIIWVKSQGNASTPRAITIDSNNFIYVTGQWAGGGWFITKFDQAGNTVLTIPYGSICISLDNANNIYIPGKKINPSGNIVWTSQAAAMMAADSAGNTYISDQGVYGVSNLTKVNQSGQVVWSYTVPYWGGCAVYCNNNAIYVAGEYGNSSSTDGMSLYKYDTNGNQLWSWQLPNPTNLNYPYFYTPHGNIKIANGMVYFSGYKQMQCAEAFLIKLSEPGIVTSIEKNSVQNAISISPNPSVSTFFVTVHQSGENTFSLKVVDALGKTVYTKQVQQFGETLNETVDLSGFNKGMYFLELSGQNFKETRKLVVE